MIAKQQGRKREKIQCVGFLFSDGLYALFLFLSYQRIDLETRECSQTLQRSPMCFWTSKKEIGKSVYMQALEVDVSTYKIPYK